MAEISGPFDSGAGSSFQEDGWGKLMRGMGGGAGGDGVIYQSAGEITSPYTGQAFNALKVSAAGGLDLNIAVGTAVLHGFLYENTATLTKTIGAAPGTVGQSRNDIVVIRLDRTANTAVVAIVAGTAAATGTQVDPALAKSATTWEIPLARITIAQGTINLSAGNITDARYFAFIPQDIRYCRLRKASAQTANGGVATWTFNTGNTGLFSSNGFLVPCNGLWSCSFYTRFNIVAGITFWQLMLQLNGVELKREFFPTAGAAGVLAALGASVELVKYPLRTGDLLTATIDQSGSSTAQMDTTSFATFGYDGPSKEPVW